MAKDYEWAVPPVDGFKSPSALLTNAELYALGSHAATPPTPDELDPFGLRLNCRGEIVKKREVVKNKYQEVPLRDLLTGLVE